MKNIVVVLVIAVIALYAMPVFADAGHGAAKAEEKSIFQKMSDGMATWKAECMGGKKVAVFQNMSVGIEEGSKKAKPQSLRTK